MGRYCDPRVLESTWSSWIMASEIPELDNARDNKLLWSHKLNGETEYCIASLQPFWFKLCNKVNLNNAIKSSFYPLDVALMHRLMAENYICEKSSSQIWDEFSSIIYKICCGVVLNFRPPNDDIKDELIQEAFTLTLTKIQRGKLKYTPGRAPAFNLLTTAIFRIMYSIKNKEKRIRDNQSDLVEQLMCGVNLPDYNSIKVSRTLVCQD